MPLMPPHDITSGDGGSLSRNTATCSSELRNHSKDFAEMLICDKVVLCCNAVHVSVSVTSVTVHGADALSPEIWHTMCNTLL